MSKMRENLIDIYNELRSDETLLRLLYYKPENALDDPLSDDKENILDRDDKWDIIQDRIKTTEKVDDLDENPKCRLLFYIGNRRSTKDNFFVSDQELVIDVFCHYSYDEVDLRMAWICDRVNELIFNKRITGLKRIQYKDGGNIKAPNGYVGYRMVFCIVSAN